MGITLEKVEPNVLEGWVGKAKGMKQAAFERGFLEIKNVHLYSKESHKDYEEETMLQNTTGKVAVVLRINVTVDRTPKCHPELAGEGIDTNSKTYLRGVPLKSRK
eukprot:10258274-Ditylum_brightwellii.AAC.1